MIFFLQLTILLIIKKQIYNELNDSLIQNLIFYSYKILQIIQNNFNILISLIYTYNYSIALNPIALYDRIRYFYRRCSPTSGSTHLCSDQNSIETQYRTLGSDPSPLSYSSLRSRK